MTSIGTSGAGETAPVTRTDGVEPAQTTSPGGADAAAPGAPGTQRTERPGTGTFLQEMLKDRIAQRFNVATATGEKIDPSRYQIIMDKGRYEASAAAFVKVAGEQHLVTVNDKAVGASGFVAHRLGRDGTPESAATCPVDPNPEVVLRKLEEIAQNEGAAAGEPLAYAITSFDRLRPATGDAAQAQEWADHRHLVALHMTESGKLRYKEVTDPKGHPLAPVLDRMFDRFGGYGKIEGMAVSDQGNRIFVGVREKGPVTDPATGQAYAKPWEHAKKTVEVHGLDMKADPGTDGNQPRPLFRIDTKAIWGADAPAEGLSGMYIDQKNGRMLVLASIEEQGVIGARLYEVDLATVEAGMKRDPGEGPQVLSGPPAVRALAKFDQKAEGITRNPETGEYVVTFDLDKEGQKKVFDDGRYEYKDGDKAVAGHGQRSSVVAIFGRDAFPPVRQP